jgi:hypothetical protein
MCYRGPPFEAVAKREWIVRICVEKAVNLTEFLSQTGTGSVIQVNQAASGERGTELKFSSQTV